MSTLEPFLQKRLVLLSQHAPAHQAARAMSSADVGCVLVGDAFGHLVGIVTDRDLACQPGVRADDGSELPLSEVMMPDPLTVDRGADLKDVIALMEEYGIRRVPVTELSRDGGRRCIGIVTMDDLIVAKAIDLESLARIVKTQMARRAMINRKSIRSWRQASRSEAHREQTLGRFHHVVGRHLGRTSSDEAAEITQILLESLVRRIHYTGAAHLIGQLPAALRENLLQLQAGPDRDITLLSITRKLSERFGVSQVEAEHLFGRFFTALGELIGTGALEHLKAQLPEDMQRLIPGPEGGSLKLAG